MRSMMTEKLRKKEVEVYRINGKIAFVLEGEEIPGGYFSHGLHAHPVGNYSYILWRGKSCHIWLNQTNPRKKRGVISLFSKDDLSLDELNELVKYLEEEGG